MKAPVNSGNGGSRQIAPEGAHVARCYQIIDKGTTFDEKWGNKKRKVQFLFELPLETAIFSEDKGEQPFYVKTIFNLSMGEKASLRKFVESWVGKKMTDAQAADFDIIKLLGHPGMVNIAHNGKDDRTYANIMSISPLPKGMACPPAINELIAYDTTEHNDAVFNKLPEFLQEDIRKSDEWIARTSAKAAVPAPTWQATTTSADEPDLDSLFANDSTGSPF
jgi:hypothetical protein